MNTIKDCVATHLWLIYICVIEVVILLTICPGIRVLSKLEDVNLSVSNTLTRINESKTLTKHVRCECKDKFDGRKFKSNVE